MSTPNFRTQTDFDLYVYDGSATQEQIDDMREANEYDESISDEKIYEWVTDDNYRFVIEDFNYALKEVLGSLKKDLQFFNIELRDGYYVGLQFYVNMDKDLSYFGGDVDEVLEYIDNEDTRYHYDMCKSEFKRKFLQEVKFINKKVLPLLAKYLGFEQYRCIGVFSNGEAVYEKVA